MNERIAKLRRQSLSTKPSVSIERARLVTRAYKKWQGEVSTPVLRALVFKYVLQNKKICINDGELIVGERGKGPQISPTYPELCCHSIEDFDIMRKRDKIAFEVSDVDIEEQAKEIIPYWKGKSIRDRIFMQMDQEWKDCYDAGIFTEFMEQRAPGHTVADSKIYEMGFLEIKNKINKRITELDWFNDDKVFEKNEELKAMIICCDALMILAKRYSDLAYELAKEELDETRKGELNQIGDRCLRVPAHKPRTFVEALQMYWFVHLGVITELNTWDSFCPGKLDQHLYPFYKKEIESGNLTREEAKEILECFWIKVNNQPAPPKVGTTLEESSTYTDFCNINIGGIKSDGTNGVNDVSYLLLEIIKEMKILQPSTNVQISKKNPDKFVLSACDVIREGMGFPSVFNTDMVVRELVRQGKSLDDARCGGTSGCVEVGCFGKEAYILTGYLNLVKILEITINNGVDKNTGKVIGLRTGEVDSFKDFKDVMQAFNKQLDFFVNIKIKGNNIIEKIYGLYMPAPFLSILIDDCIGKARDYNAGGARYNSRYIQGVGIASLADSLSSIKYHVFDQKNMTLKHLKDALDNNFSDDRIRNIILNNTPRYGNDLDYVDDIMKDAFKMFYNTVDGRKTMYNGQYRIEMLPTTCHVYFGRVVGATPDGRKAKTPLSEGISPVQGMDRNGPTAVIKSASKMDHIKTGGTLLNQKFAPELVKGQKGLEGMKNLIRVYFRLDGHHIQFNIVDAKMLRDAQTNPMEYKNLIVRVAGYSDYFNNLSKELQDEIIMRTEHENF